MIVVHRLLWEPANVADIACHHVTPEEVEEVCHSDALVEQGYSGRLRLIGPTHTGRVLAVILAPEGKGL